VSYDTKTRRAIYERTGGYCHICRKKIYFKNFGVHGARGACHVDHSTPRSRGGSDRLSNLFAACIPCNLKKGADTNRKARRPHGNRRKPPSRKDRREAINAQRATTFLGGVVGGAFGGPVGVFLGAAAGHVLGSGEGTGS